MEERDKDKTRRALRDYEDAMETRDDRKEGKPTCDRAHQMLEGNALPPLPEPKKREDKGPQSNEYQEKRKRVLGASDKLSARELQRAVDDFTPLVQAYGTAQAENGLMRKASYQLAFIRTRDRTPPIGFIMFTTALFKRISVFLSKSLQHSITRTYFDRIFKYTRTYGLVNENEG